jgi:hypothetical protein
MAGYSGTPLPKKLGIKEGHRLAVLEAPAGYPAALGELPPRVRPERRLSGGADYDVVLLFSRRRDHLARALPASLARLAPAGGLWVAWPKKASRVETDLAFESVQRLGLDLGVVDNKICALDETWSGLRFVVRREDRDGWKARRGALAPAR